MATTAINPAPSSGPQMGPGAGAAPSPQMGGTAQKLARLAMDAQQIAAENPETAPMMREVQNQVRQATMKMIQMRQQTQQATPAI